MRIKIYFNSSDSVFKHPFNKKVNGFINKVLGANNNYHGKTSRYSVSPLLGAVKVDGGFSFPNGAHLYISSDDSEFITRIMIGLMEGNGTKIEDMYYVRTVICDFNVGSVYDLVRTAPLLLNYNGRVITVKDNDFTEILVRKTRKKLIHYGLSERIANTLNFKLFHEEKAKTVAIPIGNVINIGSKVMLVAEGSKKARRMAYELGLGKCTGFGFGSVTLNEKL